MLHLFNSADHLEGAAGWNSDMPQHRHQKQGKNTKLTVTDFRRLLQEPICPGHGSQADRECLYLAALVNPPGGTGVTRWVRTHGLHFNSQMSPLQRPLSTRENADGQPSPSTLPCPALSAESH